eukprot:GFUD01125649.1.p1 GENE.GFUD01125649.1~~GFUD01125649.1.p1  ORF type:complete len:469 (+),score=91.01 GFUD01125649.1:119-1525(+)
MKIKAKILVFILGFSSHVYAEPESDRISALEKHVDYLEATLNDLEPLFVSRYGLIRNCMTPTVLNGKAQCDEKLKPGAKCSAVCNPGYIGTPGKVVTSCKEDGFWTDDLQCEIPLLLVSGGTVDQTNNGNSGVELLSFYPSNGCEMKITDMPLAGGSPRTLHNLVYVPPRQVLACNGMTTKNEASCDSWSLNNNTWKNHSYPNKGNRLTEMSCGLQYESIMCKDNKDRKKGRYAAESLHVGGETVIVGGMVYDSSGHDPSGSVRQLSNLFSDYWAKKNNLKKKRAFFCWVKVQEAGFLAIGGLGHDKTQNIVEKTMEYKRVGYGNFLGLNSISKLTPMGTPRSGHGCTGVPGDEFSVLVSGGTKGFGQTAMADVEIFNWNSNSWKNVASMKTARFGHAVVAVGEKIFAIGGDDRNQNNILDTIEEYDVTKDSWNIIQTKLKKPRSNFGYTLVPHSIFDGCVVSRPLNE